MAPAVEAAPRAALLAKEDPEIPKGITSYTLDGQQYYPDCDVCRGHCVEKAWPFDCPAFCISHCPCSVAAAILVQLPFACASSRQRSSRIHREYLFKPTT